MRGSAVVIGAGIAGLATARGLLGAGWSVRVLERSSGLPGTGTALGMWPEAMRALDRLGVGEQVRAASVEQRGARLLRPDGTEIAHLGPGRTARLVPRPALLAALAQGLPPDVIAWNAPVTDRGALPGQGGDGQGVAGARVLAGEAVAGGEGDGVAAVAGLGALGVVVPF